MLPPLCIWILANGQSCTQPALRGRPLCRAHEKSARIERTEFHNQSIRDRIAALDLPQLLACLDETLDAVLRHRISPDRQRLIYTACRHRLTTLFLAAQMPAAAEVDAGQRLTAGFDPGDPQPSRQQRLRQQTPAESMA